MVGEQILRRAAVGGESFQDHAPGHGLVPVQVLDELRVPWVCEEVRDIPGTSHLRSAREVVVILWDEGVHRQVGNSEVVCRL